MEDTTPLKQIGNYAVAASVPALLANPIVGGACLVVGGTAYIAAGLIDGQNRQDNQKGD